MDKARIKKVNMGHDGKKHIEIQYGKFFVAYNEFADLFTGAQFGFCKPPKTAGVHILRVWRFEFGWW